MKYDTTEFKKDLEDINVSLSDDQIEQFNRYYEILSEWNSFMNLTSITEYDEVMKKHFVDSLSIVKAFDLNQISGDGKEITIIDIGTGAGFPGLAIKIAFPNTKIVLLDTLNKRIKFLNHVIDELKLDNISTIHARAEDCANKTEFREKFDFCVSRAVSKLTILSEYCLPFIKVDGHFVSYKSEKAETEILEAKKAIEVLGGKYKDSVEFYLPNSDIYRNLVTIKKIKHTPKKFPRKAGTPSKEPIQ